METKELMTRSITSVGPQMTLQTAHELMLRMSARHLPVVDAGNRLVGILSDRDVLLAVGRQGDAFVYPQIPVANVMTPAPITAGVRTPIPVIASLMLEHKIDAVPVVADDQLVGLVTSTDLLALVATAPA